MFTWKFSKIQTVSCQISLVLLWYWFENTLQRFVYSTIILNYTIVANSSMHDSDASGHITSRAFHENSSISLVARNLPSCFDDFTLYLLTYVMLKKLMKFIISMFETSFIVFFFFFTKSIILAFACLICFNV